MLSTLLLTYSDRPADVWRPHFFPAALPPRLKQRVLSGERRPLAWCFRRLAESFASAAEDSSASHESGPIPQDERQIPRQSQNPRYQCQSPRECSKIPSRNPGVRTADPRKNSPAPGIYSTMLGSGKPRSKVLQLIHSAAQQVSGILQAVAGLRVPIRVIVNADPGRALVVDVGQDGAARNCLRKATRSKAEHTQNDAKRTKRERNEGTPRKEAGGSSGIMLHVDLSIETATDNWPQQ
jgi:hypothetical protein